jgi:hypothetical protein
MQGRPTIIPIGFRKVSEEVLSEELAIPDLNIDRVMRWRLIREEYGPEIIYTKSSTNMVADALSRLDIKVEDTNVNAKFFDMICEANALPVWHGETKSTDR